MKKILITTGIFAPEIGGPASYVKAIAGALKENSHQVTIVTYSLVWQSKEDKALNYRIIRIWQKWPWLLRHFIYVWKVFWAARSHDRIFALNALNAGPVALLAARFFKKDYLVRIPGDRAWETAIQNKSTRLLINDFQKFKRQGWAGIIHRLQVWVCTKAKKVIVPSKYLAKMVADWGIAEEKIVVIYNGADFKPSQLTKEEARKAIGIPGNLIVSAGRLVPWKGFRMLIKIMPQLLTINQFFRLVIVGDGPDMSSLRAMVKNLNLDRKVFIVGKKTASQLAEYLAAADVFVLNTGYEGFSHQILEAMIAGAPVITTAVGGNKEIIHQGDNGFMIKYNDEFNLVEAIKMLWQSPELRDEFIVAGKKTVQRFNLEKMIKETIALLET